MPQNNALNHRQAHAFRGRHEFVQQPHSLEKAVDQLVDLAVGGARVVDNNGVRRAGFACGDPSAARLRKSTGRRIDLLLRHVVQLVNQPADLAAHTAAGVG